MHLVGRVVASEELLRQAANNPSMNRRLLTTLLLAAVCAIGAAARSRAVREHAMPDEAAVRDLNTHHLFAVPPTRAAWEERKRQLREQILFSAGLWPMPKKTPLHPLVTGRYEGPDFEIENVAIQTMPGFYLCGNLYLPKGKRGPFPGIVNPHGHWEHGRLEMEPDVPKADPPPARPAPGRGNLVAIGVNLARQGFVVFAYDMVGYNDTIQIPDHRVFANNPKAWLWNVSLMGLQLWNSIRVVDYLSGLKQVDPKRIGVTGASGGGTQTFLLTAVDDRIAASVPVNMVCAYMQGGCLCENGPGLRVGTDNVEIAAMLAPKPQLLVAATGDWTSHVPTEEWPAMKRVYDLYGAGDRTACAQFNYEHNYNVESREAMYAWFGRWLLHDSDPEHFRERPFDIEVSRLRVWTADHPMPKDALDEAGLTKAMINGSETRLAALWPHDAEGQRVYRAALQHSLGLNLDPNRELHPYSKVPLPDNGGFAGVQRVLLVVNGSDHQAAAERLLRTANSYQQTLGYAFGGTQFALGSQWNDFFTCYNRPSAGEVVQGILDELEVYRRRGVRPRSIDLVGLGDAGPIALLARPFIGLAGRTVVDMDGFDTESDQAYADRLYAPGLRAAGGLRAAAMLSDEHPLCLFNHAWNDLRAGLLQVDMRANNPSSVLERGQMSVEQIVEWLAQNQ